MDNILKIDDETDTINLVKNITSPISDFDTLVLSGGSSKGILILGALQYAYDNFLLNKIYKYIGTSIGSIICFFFINRIYTHRNYVIFMYT